MKLYFENYKYIPESISIRAIDADDEIYHDIDFVLAKDIYYAPSIEDLGLSVSEARDIGFKINVDGSVIIPKSTPFHLTMRGSYTGFPQFVFNRSGENFDISQDDNGLNLIYVYKNKV